MHVFDHAALAGRLDGPQVGRRLAALHSWRERQAPYLAAFAGQLDALKPLARLQGSGASNRLEGIATTQGRLEDLVLRGAAPRTRAEAEIAGYAGVCALVQERHDFLSPRPSVILQMHRDLYAYSSLAGGSYKVADNRIAGTDAEGHVHVRFAPVPAYLTPMAMADMCDCFGREWEKGTVDRLLLVPLFVLDFLCIHPFPDGNGRMSRLLSTLLFCRAGHPAGLFVALEQIVEERCDAYYGALAQGSSGWHENRGDCRPFVVYLLDVLEEACARLQGHIDRLRAQGADEKA